MPDGTNTIRFKRGDVEFELVGSQADIAKAWSALEESVVAAFTTAPTKKSSSEGLAAAASTTTPPSSKKSGGRKRAASRGGDQPTSDIRQRLLEARLDSFPDVGKNPPALHVGYAVLRWAREDLGIGELTVPDIYAVAHRLRIPHSENAYREAFRPHPRAVNKTTKTPQTYELMNPGDDALDAYLSKVAAGGSPSEAEAQAEQAEEKAKA